MCSRAREFGPRSRAQAVHAAAAGRRERHRRLRGADRGHLHRSGRAGRASIRAVIAGSARSSRCLGRVESGVVEIADIFTSRGNELVRAEGYPPHADRFVRHGIDLPACSPRVDLARARRPGNAHRGDVRWYERRRDGHFSDRPGRYTHRPGQSHLSAATALSPWDQVQDHVGDIRPGSATGPCTGCSCRPNRCSSWCCTRTSRPRT